MDNLGYLSITYIHIYMSLSSMRHRSKVNMNKGCLIFGNRNITKDHIKSHGEIFQ